MFRRYVVVCFAVLALGVAARGQQLEFEVASIHPSSGSVNGERGGITEVAHGTVKMHDVTVASCMHFAYGAPEGIVSGPPTLTSVHYDIVAKADPATTPEQLRLMMRTLLAERFRLVFHTEKKELRVYTLVLPPGGLKATSKLHAVAADAAMHHENSNRAFIAHGMTMHELADYLSDPLGAPLTDSTGLAGRYDFTMDFNAYVDMERTDATVRPDPVAVLRAALKGELGLDLVQGREMVDVYVVDQVEQPSAN